MRLGEKQSRDLKPDAQAFDEVRITTVPRYKQSGLSGDEWRISAKIQFMRNGNVIIEQESRDIQTACYHLGYYHDATHDAGHAFFAGENDICDQEGCAELATVTYRKKLDFCREGKPHPIEFGEKIRRFCDRHKTRGDCGLDDADANYEQIGTD